MKDYVESKEENQVDTTCKIHGTSGHRDEKIIITKTILLYSNPRESSLTT